MWKVELDWRNDIRPFKICEVIYIETPFGQAHISKRVIATFDFKEATEEYISNLVAKLSTEDTENARRHLEKKPD